MTSYTLCTMFVYYIKLAITLEVGSNIKLEPLPEIFTINIKRIFNLISKLLGINVLSYINRSTI